MGLFYTEYQKAKSEYQSLLGKTGDIKEKHKKIRQLTFELLAENQLMENLILIKENETGFKYFHTAQESIQWLDALSGFAERRKKLCDDAAEVYLFCQNLLEINRFIDNNVFFGNEYRVQEYPEAYRIAKDYLKYAPEFSKYYTNEALSAIYQSILSSLSKKEIIAFVEQRKNALPLNILEDLPLTGSPEYLNNLLYVREMTGIPIAEVENSRLKLKGVSHKNDDGTDRQEFLKELHGIYQKKPQRLVIKKGEYNGEPSAAVMWGEKMLGFLPADFVKQIEDKYVSYEFTVELVSVSGGDDYNYGCTVDVHVFGVQKSNLKIGEFLKSRTIGTTQKETEEEKDGCEVEELEFE